MQRFFLVLFALFFSSTSAALLMWPGSEVMLIFCDVGQGDATLITTGYTQIVIDGGPDESVLECLGQYMPYWDTNIELVVASHPDADHIGGLIAVLKKYQVSEIWDNGQHERKGTTIAADFATLVSLQTNNGGYSRTVSSGDSFSVGDNLLIASVLSPSSKGESIFGQNKGESETALSDKKRQKTPNALVGNNGSIALLLDITGVKILLVGDLEKEGELALLQQALIPDVNILKVGHHGAKSSSTDAFLLKSRPEIALIGVGRKNKYGHPAPEVIDRLKQLNAVIVRTDEAGSVPLLLKNGQISSSFFEKLDR